jgi:hypothetical protein
MKPSRHPVLVGVLVFMVLWVASSRVVPHTVCRDDWPSASIGRRGACSHHGGVGTNWLALLATLASAGCGVAVSRWLSSRTEKARRAQYEAQAKETELRPPGRDAQRSIMRGTFCPSCRAPMRLRTARKGRFAGQQFWGCSKYPRCRGVRPFQPD